MDTNVSEEHIAVILIPEDEDYMILRNVGTYIEEYTASHAKPYTWENAIKLHPQNEVVVMASHFLYKFL